MNKGSKNNYFWFQTFDGNYTIDRFLKKFNNYLIDKYVCISAFDSGPLILSEDEAEEGWKEINNVCISPKIKIDTEIPTAEFDEWYIFSSLPESINLNDVFVNYAGFYLSNETDLIKSFWECIEQNSPYMYISEGGGLIIVTNDLALKQELELWCPPRSEC